MAKLDLGDKVAVVNDKAPTVVVDDDGSGRRPGHLRTAARGGIDSTFRASSTLPLAAKAFSSLSAISPSGIKAVTARRGRSNSIAIAAARIRTFVGCNGSL